MQGWSVSDTEPTALSRTLLVGPTDPADGTGLFDAEPRVLKALLRMSEAVLRAEQFDDVLAVIGEQALSALGAASLSISRLDPLNSTLTALVTVGDPIATGQCGAGLAVPVVYGDSMWGELRALGGPGRTFDDADARLLHSIAAHTAVAIGRAELLTTMRAYALQDPLTGIANRRAVDQWLDQIDWQATSPALLMCDLDGFKKINDRDGHPAGDALLRGVAAVLDRCAGTIDGAKAARMGGDEFCVLLSDATLASAQVFADDATQEIRAVVDPAVTVSWGAAVAGPQSRSGAELLAAADAALLEAKRQGPARYSTAAVTTAVPDGIDRRSTSARGIAALPAAIVGILSGRERLTVLEALEILALQAQQAVGTAAWSISLCSADGTAVDSVRSVDSVRKESGLSVLTDLGPSHYALADYPASARAIADGSTFVAAVGLDGSDPAEVALLTKLGYRAVLGVGVMAGSCRYLLELYSHDGHAHLVEIAPHIEVLAAYCVSRSAVC
ncbi:diguanylate cyclase domain-containing protein [Mycolicibacterium sp.]|uniref:GGDEF domain-containing protein n=1 Tax=Mycolicibacterium sp. TaxID=2320850 RepID=UPI003D0CB041